MNKEWESISIKLLISLIFSLVFIGITYLLRLYLRTDTLIADASGLGLFTSIFGTLYGILMAFIIFEVWAQFNKTSQLFDTEAVGLERLYRLTLYFRKPSLSLEMKAAIKKYIEAVSLDFNKLRLGERGKMSGKIFRELSKVIRTINIKTDREKIVFQRMMESYGHLTDVRVERISQSLTRLPTLLKVFLYLSSFFVLLTFLVMPFASLMYSLLSTGMFSFILAMIFQIVEDLDNPFTGFWSLTPEPYERTLKHIEEDY
ncbi:MAG: DUF4239 domain-containing protein [Nanoarchaeota archaeon]